ncbi:MAG: hypothetical protein A2040_07230 [Rhodocyclales bacterium GWA2_65_19]|nr:MAG: hypothetical protein A2040_07230 [Rhodocyclales bacterium GWA2_65_19]
MSTGAILLTAGLYLGLLFAVAYLVDTRGRRGVLGQLPEAWIYALSIAVYCTSWTFFGSVGRSATTGYGFLPVYIGPVLVFVFAQPFLRKLLAVSKTQHITSIADLIAARYGKRQSLAGLVTAIAVIGIVPYISLQLKAVSSTFDILRGAAEGYGPIPLYADTALYVALVMSLFVMVFGTRRVDATEQHHGMVTAVALESLVKLIAFLLVGTFVTYGLNDGFADILDSVAATPTLSHLIDFGAAASAPDFWALTFLSALAIFCLPRQFQVTVVENTDSAHLRQAAWIFPFYLLAINIFVLPIAMAGLLHIREFGGDPDTFVLTLPLAAGHSWLALLAFIGGFSAATGMIIVETIALSTMVSNDLVLPLLLRGKRFSGEGRESVVELVKWVRRASIALILLLAFAYVRLIGNAYALVSIGLVSFAAVAQFAPSIVGGLYWRRGNFFGAVAGLAAGFVLWLYTLLLPSFAESGWISRDFMTSGAFGIEALRPYALFGVAGLDRISHSLLWSLLANVGVYLACSFFFAQKPDDSAQASAFVDAYAPPPTSARVVAADLRWRDLGELLGIFLGVERAARKMGDYAAQRHLAVNPEGRADAALVDHVEKLVAGAVGSSLARVVVAAAAKERQDSAEMMHLLSDASSQIEMQWERLREAVQNIGQGISMFDAELKLVVWNQRFLELLEFPESLGAVNTPFDAFIRYNAERGEYGPGEVEEQVHERVLRARRFEPHLFERERPDGRIIEVSGKPLPRGGFITTYLDITERKRNEQALREARDELEQRVLERTHALQESEERFRNFAESASDWLWETGPDLRFTYFSERASELLGRPTDALIGKTRAELASAEELQRAPEKWRQHLELIAAHRPFRAFDYQVASADGSFRQVRISGKPVFKADGSFAGYRGTGTDITELIQAQNELMSAEKLAALGGMVAGIAHEINTPIGIGVTAASFLQEQTSEFEKLYAAGQIKRVDMEAYLHTAHEATSSLTTNLRRAAGLVQSFKQVAVDQTSEQRRRFRFKDYISEILDSMRPRLKRTEHTVDVNCPDELELDSYPGAFSQILTNLIINSLIHGFEHLAAGRIEIVVWRSDKELFLRYSDNGCGMSQAQVKRVFEPFFTTRRGQGGSGLGMHVVYSLVTRTLRGRIECRSTPGTGVQFLVTVPIDEEAAREPQSAA